MALYIGICLDMVDSLFGFYAMEAEKRPVKSLPTIF